MRKAAATSFAVLLASCNAASPAPATPTQTPVAAPLAGMEFDATSLRQELAAVRGEIEELKKRQMQDDSSRILQQAQDVAYLQAGDEGYSTVRYDLGVLTVQLADVSAYANGSKVRLKFGNPLATNVNGLKTTIDWGPTDKLGFPDSAATKSKTVTFVEPMRSGAWTSVSVVLEDVPPTELGYVRLRDISHTGIELSR